MKRPQDIISYQIWNDWCEYVKRSPLQTILLSEITDELDLYLPKGVTMTVLDCTKFSLHQLKKSNKNRYIPVIVIVVAFVAEKSGYIYSNSEDNFNLGENNPFRRAEELSIGDNSIISAQSMELQIKHLERSILELSSFNITVKSFLKFYKELVDFIIPEISSKEVSGTIRIKNAHIARYYLDNPSLTFEQVSAEFGLTRERIRQIIQKYLNKLQTPSIEPIKTHLSEVYKELLDESKPDVINCLFPVLTQVFKVKDLPKLNESLKNTIDQIVLDSYKEGQAPIPLHMLKTKLLRVFPTVTEERILAIKHNYIMLNNRYYIYSDKQYDVVHRRLSAYPKGLNIEALIKHLNIDKNTVHSILTRDKRFFQTSNGDWITHLHLPITFGENTLLLYQEGLNYPRLSIDKLCEVGHKYLVDRKIYNVTSLGFYTLCQQLLQYTQEPMLHKEIDHVILAQLATNYGSLFQKGGKRRLVSKEFIHIGQQQDNLYWLNFIIKDIPTIFQAKDLENLLGLHYQNTAHNNFSMWLKYYEGQLDVFEYLHPKLENLHFFAYKFLDRENASLSKEAYNQIEIAIKYNNARYKNLKKTDFNGWGTIPKHIDQISNYTFKWDVMAD